MRRAIAPSFQPAEAGGGDEKAHTGCVRGKNTGRGRGRRCNSLCPRSLTGRAPESCPGRCLFESGRGCFLFIWVPKCVNTQEPATSARIRGTDCTDEGNLSIYFIRAFVKELVMNCLKLEKKIQILNCLVEGNSIRSTERMTGVHRDTIMRLLSQVGVACAKLLDEKLVNLNLQQVEVDEIWCYVGKKQKNVKADDKTREVGDQYVFVAMDAESKLIPSYLVGKRSEINAQELMRDLRFRVNGRPQLTTDGFKAYVEAVEKAFGSEVDYSQLVKIYRGDETKRARYSPGEFVKSFPTPVTGNPNPDRISTSYIERQNLTMRMQMRRFTRLTNAFSKKLGNLKAAVALHFAHYNFMRIHKSLRCTPAMQAGIADHVWTWEELLTT